MSRQRVVMDYSKLQDRYNIAQLPHTLVEEATILQKSRELIACQACRAVK